MNDIQQLTQTVVSKLSPSQAPPQTTASSVAVTLVCPACGEERSDQYPPPQPKNARYAKECEVCEKARRSELFKKTCPVLYQNTDVGRLPRVHTEVMRWTYGARGLVLIGATGLCKSRSMWLLLNRLLTIDKPERKFIWFDCVGFSHAIAMHYKKEDAEEWLERVAAVPVLFFDDLGKLKLTERAETELFGVIDRRISHGLPLLATTNDSGDSLAARMTENRGPAMIRRLREFCDVIQF